ncbi:MAG: hypothetical protein RPR91_06660, partial [Colwellia sp.]
QLNIINIADPLNLKHVYAYDVQHGREDFELDGIYDVKVVGNLAYISVNYSDQEDTPVNSSIEVVDVSKHQQFNYLETRNAVTHESPSLMDVGARGFTVAHNEIYVAKGKQGIGELELNSLTILGHSPAAGEVNVATDINFIDIQLSHPLKLNQDLSDYVTTWKQIAGLGDDVSSQFDLTVVNNGNDGDSSRVLRLTLTDTVTLSEGETYVVHIASGLLPITGGAMQQSYEFSFVTVANKNALLPDIETVTPFHISTQGNEVIEVVGSQFDESLVVKIGGQLAPVQNFELIDGP